MIHNQWDNVLKEEYQKPYFIELIHFLRQEYQTKIIYPPKQDVFNALIYTSYEDVKVVILGQDPYHNPHQAHGLAFSVGPGVPLPPSLKNIYKELHDDLGCSISQHGTLTKWAKQGVLLLNTIMSVEQNKPASHANKGWETFTNAIIAKLNEREQPIVFMLWGNPAKQKGKIITNPNHLVLKSAHPSPLSAYNGFFGCHHFSQANNFLIQHHMQPIDWQID